MPPRGYAYLIATICGWGLAWPMIKIGLNEIPVWAYRGLMLPAAGLITLALAWMLGETIASPRGQWGPLLATSALNITCWTLFSTLGLNLMGSSGHASIIAYTMPLWAMLFATLFAGDRPSWIKLCGLALGLTGLAILLSGELGVMAESPMGTAFMLCAAACWGAGTVVHKRVVWRLPPLTLTAWMLLVGSVPITLVGLATEVADLKPISMEAVWATVFVLLISTVFCWFSWFQVVRLAPVVVSTVGLLMVPVMAVISGGLILNESVGMREISALACVICAIALVLIPFGRLRTN